MGVKCNLPQEHRIRLLENRVPRKIFGRQREEITGNWRKNYTMRSFVICTHPIFLGHEIQANEKRGAYDTYEGEDKCIEGFGGETRPLGSSKSINQDDIKV